MLFTKTNPIGIDLSIQKLQSHLHDELLKLWGIDTAFYECFGRCYRNQTQDGYKPEVYTGFDNYRDVYVNDGVAALSFFGLSNKIDFEIINKTDVHLIFIVNINKVKSLAHRGDEEVRKDIQGLCNTPIFGFTLKGMDLGIDNVFKEYSGWSKSEGIKYRDMHPFHCFRLNFELTYNINQCEQLKF